MLSRHGKIMIRIKVFIFWYEMHAAVTDQDNTVLAMKPREMFLTWFNSYKPASFLWDIGKQHSLICDAAERGVPSGAILFAQSNFIEK